LYFELKISKKTVSTIHIDRVTIGSSIVGDWSLGKHAASSLSIRALNSALDKLNDDTSGYILFVSPEFVIDEEVLLKLLSNNSSTQVWYDDQAAISAITPRVTQLISPGIYFNLPLTSGGFSIWNISLQCLVVKKEVIRSLGFLNPSFESVEGAMIDWVYRLLYGGAFLERMHVLRPDQTKSTPSGDIIVADEFRYIKNRLGKKWLTWSFFRYTLGGLASFGEVWQSFNKVRKEGSNKVPTPLKHDNWRKASLQKASYKISIIIPTVERYPYLVTALNQLLLQTILPFEVIVIDQTSLAERRPELFTGYDTIGLRYITMDQSGQCGSRNLGLLQSSGDYILFIDDDVEVKPDLLEQHMRCMEYFNTDVSCGVCDEVDAGPIPYDHQTFRCLPNKQRNGEAISIGEIRVV
jgi:Glycosyl transferase family 2